MDDRAFWAEVKRLNWPAMAARVQANYERRCADPSVPYFDFDGESDKLLKRASGAYWVQFHWKLAEKRVALFERMTEWERRQGVRECERRMDLGVDGFRELTNHVVGMGRDTYEAVMADPSKAEDFRDSHVESFSYLIPYVVVHQLPEGKPNPPRRKKKGRRQTDARSILRRAMRGT